MTAEERRPLCGNCQDCLEATHRVCGPLEQPKPRKRQPLRYRSKQAMRALILSLRQSERLTNSEIAERLGVTPRHIDRLSTGL